jgi:hypothetical protein
MGDHLPRGASPTYWRTADAAGVFQANSHEAAATLLKMKGFILTFTLTVTGWRAIPLIMRDFPVTFTLTIV